MNSAPQPVIHGSFTVQRDLDVAPDSVFAAYADPAIRKRWFRIPSTQGDARHELDFRVGGHESATSTFAPSWIPEQLSYHATFRDIVPGTRIVFTYAFALDDVTRWVSLVTIQLSPHGDGTRLTHTEQYAYLAYTEDGRQDVAHLKGGVGLQLNALAAVFSHDLR